MKLIVRWLVPGRAIKVLKDSQGWKTPFFKKIQPSWFLHSFFGRFIEKQQVFVLLKKTTQKPHSELFYYVMQYHHLQNHTIINCYSYYGILIWVERNAPNFVFAKCCWSVHSKVTKLSKNVHCKQRKPLPHKLCSFTWSLCTSSDSSASIVYFFQYIAWFGMVQHPKQLGCKEGRKID